MCQHRVGPYWAPIYFHQVFACLLFAAVIIGSLVESRSNAQALNPQAFPKDSLRNKTRVDSGCSVDLTSAPSDPATVGSTQVSGIPADCKSIRGIALTDNDLMELSKHQSIEVVALFATDRITGIGLAKLGALPKLRELVIERCVNFDEVECAQIATITQLQTLRLRHSEQGWDGTRVTRRITDRGVVALATLPRLEVLELSGLPGITSACIKAFAVKPQLTELVLGGYVNRTVTSATKVSDESLVNAAGITTLKKLTLTGRGLLTFKGFTALASMPALSVIQCGGRVKVRSAGLQNVAVSKTITSLEIRGLDACDDDVVGMLTKFPSLAELHLPLPDSFSKAASDILANLTQIVQLDLWPLGVEPPDNAPAAALSTILKNKPQLLNLRLTSFSGIEASLLDNRESCAKLSVVALEYCESVSPPVLALFSECNALTELTFGGYCRGQADTDSLKRLSRLSKLRKLDLADLARSVAAEAFDPIWRLASLEELTFETGRHVELASLKGISALARLSKLYIKSRNPVDELFLNSISALSGIESLNLATAGCKPPVFKSGAWRKFAKLKTLVLGNEYDGGSNSVPWITDDLALSLAELTNLRELSIANCSASSAKSFIALAGMKDLRFLLVSKSGAFASDLLKTIAGSNLEVLVIKESKAIGDDDLLLFAASRRLCRLEIYSCTPLTGTGSEKLSEQAPWCYVGFAQ